MPSIPSPIGTIAAYAGPFFDAAAEAAWEQKWGWLVCDGRALKPTDPVYKDLFTAIGTSWGGDAAALFNIPDLRGLFLRGVTGKSKNDPEAAERAAINVGGY